MVDKVVAGARYRVLEDVPTLCCGHALRAGSVVRVDRQPTPNRLIVHAVVHGGAGGFHKVERSAFRMRVEVDRG